MSQQLVIDPQRFVREARQLQGSLDLARLPRLHDMLAQVVGSVQYSLQGFAGERGQPRLHLEVSAVLPLICQRCLGAVEEVVDIDTQLELVPEGVELTQEELEDDSLDFLPVAGALDVMALIEDEILLALPVAPRHAVCNLPSDADAGQRPHPFAALSVLKTKLN